MMEAGLIGSNLLLLFPEGHLSEQAVEWVTGKIVLDANFREALIADPDQALSGFDLNESEKAWLKRVDFETMEALAQALVPCINSTRRWNNETQVE